MSDQMEAAPEGLKSIPALLQISANLCTAGQPRREQFTCIHRAGYEVVINLARPDSPGAIEDEASLVRGLGMDYYPIPVIWEKPTQEDLQAFFDLMEHLAGKKVFIHCAKNMRVSVFVFLYRVLRLKEPADQAFASVLEIWQPDGVWQAFIENTLAGPSQSSQ